MPWFRRRKRKNQPPANIDVEKIRLNSMGDPRDGDRLLFKGAIMDNITLPHEIVLGLHNITVIEGGVELNDGITLPAQATCIDAPTLWPRDPPVRFRKTVPDAWLELTIREGRNRQVRRMTAAVGHPTLRLIRCRIGDWSLDELAPGQWRELAVTGPVQRRFVDRADYCPPRRA